MALVKDPSIYKTFRKKNKPSAADTVELATEIKSKRKKKKKEKESTAECQKTSITVALRAV